MDRTRLVELLIDSFPEWNDLPETCWVRGAIDRNWDSWTSAIALVSTHGGRDVLMERIRDEHPVARRVDKEADQGLRSALAEAEAFAWAVQVGGFRNPRFASLREGMPDIECDGPVWIEAKTIGSSDLDRSAQALANLTSPIGFRIGTPEPAGRGFFNKFEGAFEDAQRKFDRALSTGEHASRVVFFHLTEIDLNIFGYHEDAVDKLNGWANRTARECDVRIVLIRNMEWETPVFDTNDLPRAGTM